jgi:hypothetical protein
MAGERDVRVERSTYFRKERVDLSKPSGKDW